MSASEPRDNTFSVFRCGDNFSGPLNREIETTMEPWMPKKAVPDVYFTDDSILVITWLGAGYDQSSDYQHSNIKMLCYQICYWIENVDYLFRSGKQIKAWNPAQESCPPKSLQGWRYC